MFMHYPDGTIRDVIVAGHLQGPDHVHTETPESRPPDFSGLKEISGVTTGVDATLYGTWPPASWTGGLELGREAAASSRYIPTGGLLAPADRRIFIPCTRESEL